MGKNVIGIDISDFSIEAIALDKSRSGFSIDAYSRFRLSPDIVEDGKVLNPDRLKEAIEKMLSHSLPHSMENYDKVVLSVPESVIFSEVISLPKNIKEKDLKKIALNKAEESVPESMDNLISVTKILPSTDNHHHVFYAGAKIDVVKSLVGVFNDLNMDIQAIVPEAISSFAGLKKIDSKQTFLLLDLGARTTVASIFSNNCLCSSINVAIAGDNITKAIASKLNISYNAAEEKKVRIGLNSDGDGETMLIVQGQLQPLLDELKIYVQYWENSHNKKIDQVFLVGGLAQMKGADRYFGENLGIPTQLGESFVDESKFPEGVNFSKYINAIGLARLSYQDIEIDFYKHLEKIKKDKKEESKENKDKETKSFKTSTIFKNKFLWIALGLIILAALVFLFRVQISNLYNSFFAKEVNNNTSVSDNNAAPDNKIADEQPVSLSEEIVIAETNINQVANFVAAEYYSVDFEAVFQPEREPDYTKALELLEAQADKNVVDLVNDVYVQENYFIIPNIISYENLGTNPQEAEYQAGQLLTANLRYKFMMFSEEKVKEWLVAKHPELSGQIENLSYFFKNYSLDESGYIFNIRVDVNK